MSLIRSNSGVKLGAGMIFAALAICALPSQAEARAFIGFGFGFPGYYYPPPPVYYGPPPPPYDPPPEIVYEPPPPPPPPPPEETSQNCRPYSRSIVIDGKPQVAEGTVCQQPNGKWKIVQ